MFDDKKPLVDQISEEGYEQLYRETKSQNDVAYSNAKEDFVPTVADLQRVLRDPQMGSLPVRRKR